MIAMGNARSLTLAARIPLLVRYPERFAANTNATFQRVLLMCCRRVLAQQDYRQRRIGAVLISRDLATGTHTAGCDRWAIRSRGHRTLHALDE